MNPASASVPIATGDIIIQNTEEGGWLVLKILGVDVFANGFSTAHRLAYNDASNRPTLASQ